jgi:hypothetical protein
LIALADECGSEHGEKEKGPYYFLVALFFRGTATGETSASVHAFVISFAFFAVSRFTAAIACPLMVPAILFALLRKMLINGFFIMVLPVQYQ